MTAITQHAGEWTEHRPPAGEQVAVAMSGGVDSSVAAAMLVRQGYQVVGVHMKLHALPDEEKREKSCCSIDDALDARQACDQLGIPFYVLDYTEQFNRLVIDYFQRAYLAGQTPNPCVMCNQEIKSRLLLEQVRQFGCTHLATGHYARIMRDSTGRLGLWRAADRRKDQTYFLFGTPREELPFLMYPLAGLEKRQTREIAGQEGFFSWNKADSQNICFVPKDYRDFLGGRLDERINPPGDIVDPEGRVLGRHRGMAFYTIGQRRGLGLSASEPRYVVALKPESNQVVLGPEEALYSSRHIVREVNWVSWDPIEQPARLQVQVRYAHQAAPATVRPLGQDRVAVEFEQPVKAITPGQAAVFYEGDLLVGGGWLEPTG